MSSAVSRKTSKRFLLQQTSLLDRLRPARSAMPRSTPPARPTCSDASSGPTSSSVPLDQRRTSYRYHQLFGELLRHELELSDPELVTTLHRRASVWHRSSGSISAAIDHACAAGDMDEVREMVRYWADSRRWAAGDGGEMAGTRRHLSSWSSTQVCASPGRGSRSATVGQTDDLRWWIAAAQSATRARPAAACSGTAGEIPLRPRP